MAQMTFSFFFWTVSPLRQQLMKLDTLKFGLLGASNKFSLQNVFFRNEKTTIYANGTLEFLEPYNTHAIVQLLAKFDTGPDISVDLNISGHQKKLIAKLGFRDNLTRLSNLT